MIFNPFIVIAMALALSACAASPPPQANPKARVLKWFAIHADAVQAEADRHCKQFGKSARITEVRTDAGGHALFECASPTDSTPRAVNPSGSQDLEKLEPI